MLSTCLTLLAVAVQAGQVVSLPHTAHVTPAGRVYWVLQSENIKVPRAVRGLITRVAPEGLTGVVEIKFYDGTNRLGWLDVHELTVVEPPNGGQRGGQLRAPVGPILPERRQAERVDLRYRRQVQQQHFMKIDLVLGHLIQSALRSAAAEPTGPILTFQHPDHAPLVDLTDPLLLLGIPDGNDLRARGRHFHEPHWPAH